MILRCGVVPTHVQETTGLSSIARPHSHSHPHPLFSTNTVQLRELRDQGKLRESWSSPHPASTHKLSATAYRSLVTQDTVDRFMSVAGELRTLLSSLIRSTEKAYDEQPVGESYVSSARIQEMQKELASITERATPTLANGICVAYNERIGIVVGFDDAGVGERQVAIELGEDERVKVAESEVEILPAESGLLFEFFVRAFGVNEHGPPLSRISKVAAAKRSPPAIAAFKNSRSFRSFVCFLNNSMGGSAKMGLYNNTLLAMFGGLRRLDILSNAGQGLATSTFKHHFNAMTSNVYLSNCKKLQTSLESGYSTHFWADNYTRVLKYCKLSMKHGAYGTHDNTTLLGKINVAKVDMQFSGNFLEEEGASPMQREEIAATIQNCVTAASKFASSTLQLRPLPHFVTLTLPALPVLTSCSSHLWGSKRKEDEVELPRGFQDAASSKARRTAELLHVAEGVHRTLRHHREHVRE